MAVSALTNFTLPPLSHMNHAPKFSHSTARSSSKTHNVSSSSSSVCYHRQQPVRELNVSSKPSLLAFPSSTQNNISKFFVENIATILLGSLIFMGCLKSSPVLATPVRDSHSFEDKRGTQSEISTDDEDEEEIMCAKLLKEDPESIEALKMAVTVKMRRGKTGEAAKYVKRLIELQPDQMEWRILQASCYEVMGNWTKAKRLFKKILKLNPIWVKALHGVAMVMHKEQEGPAVFEMLEEALEVARRKKRANLERNIRILIAQMHAMKENLKEAAERFQVLIFENPRDFRPYVCQAIVYAKLGEGKEARKIFEIGKSLTAEGSLQRKFLDSIDLTAFDRKPGKDG